MAVCKCKMCGGDLQITELDKVVECEYCGTTQTVPSADNEKKMTLFNRANRLRSNNEFDKAAALFEQLVAEFPEEAEAYWGLCLCSYGIEYVDDPATGKKIPTCHRASFEKLSADENFNLAMEYADVIAQRQYRAEAREIDRINEEILSVSRNETPYDIFICYKDTDENGGRTPDSVMAQDIYEALTAKGYKVFFSRISLEDKLGQQYEPYIFAALNSSKIMLSVGTKYEYFHAVWVKNEWSRFLRLAAKDKSKTLIPCYKDMDPYDMPDEFKALQGQDLGKLGAMQDLVRGIDKLIGIHTASTLEPASKSTGALTKRGYIFLEDQNYKTADDYFERALDENPEDSKAYLGKVLSALRLSTEEELNNVLFDPDSFKDFGRAIRFSDGVEKNALLSISETAKKKYYAKCFSSGISRLVRKLEREELKKEEEKRRREEEEHRREEEDRKKAEEAELQKTAEKVIAALRRKQQESTGGSLEQQLAAKRQEISFLTTVCNNYDGIVVQLTQKYNEQSDLQNQINGLQAQRNALGVFSGKEKKRLDGEIFNQTQQIQTLSSEIAALTNNLYGFQNKKQAEQALNSAKAAEENIESQITSRQKQVGDAYTFEQAMEILKNDVVVNQKVSPRFGCYPQASKTDKSPIEWMILKQDGNKMLLLSKYALDCEQYNYNVVGEDVTWESCTLRKWLNNDFMNTAFTEDEQAHILPTRVRADANPEYQTPPGNDTTDNVFLLSIDEVYRCFQSDDARKCTPTAYAVKRGVYTWEEDATSEEEPTCWWLLRSPGWNTYFAAYVDNFGSVNSEGSITDGNRAAVRPAIWIDLSSLQF